MGSAAACRSAGGELRRTGDFGRIHALPGSGADVPDDLDARLVVLSADHPYSKEPSNAAEALAKAILASRGNAPRLFQNSLVFLAADKVRLQDLDDALRRFLAWESIVAERETLNLDAHQAKQAETQMKSADGAVTARLPETYQWLLVPEQATPQSPVVWQAIRLTGSEALAVRASKRLRNDELLVGALGCTILRKHLDEVPLWRGDNVAVRQLVDDFARYLYLPRLAGPEVLIQAVKTGVELMTWPQDSFALAESFDEASGRYRGLRAGQIAVIAPDSSALLVKGDVARLQMDAERATATAVMASEDSRGAGDSEKAAPSGATTSTRETGSVESPTSRAPMPRRYHGTVTLDPARVGRDASRIADEVIAHLAGQVGVQVRVTLEIDATLPNGATDQIVRTVTENSRSLRFESHGFERE